MTAVDLREAIADALRVMWPGFAERHPRLAMFVDQGLLLDGVVEQFEEDADYQHALADAAARGATQGELKRLIRILVRTWLRTLVL